jgi:uncharacterized protein YjbI with pentapeptide repeats
MVSSLHKANLRGHSFKKKDLRGEDFSGSDIRGANFADAILTRANFKQSKTGLRPIAVLALAASSTILMVLTGLVAGYAGAFPVFITSLLAEESGSDKNLLVVAGSGILVGFIVVIVRRGLGASLGILTISLAVVTAVVGFAGTGNLLAAAWVQAIAIAVAVGGVLMGALAIAIFMTVTSSRLWVISVFAAILGATPGALEGIKKPANMPGLPTSIALAMTGMMAFALLSLSLYVGMQSLSGNRKYTVIQTLVVNLCTALGTQFLGAILTDADFTQAVLPHTDFRDAVLTRTNWFQVKGLERSRVEGTYLANEAVRQLAISKNGQNGLYDDENLRGLNLQNATLEGASFIGTDLSEANLQNADLTKAKLAEAQLYGTNLSNACLTKACIQDWAISTDTQLENIRCEEIYMRLPTDDDPDPWRKPDSRNETFKEGDFTDFIAPIMKTLDLYRQQNVDPRQIGSTLKTLDLYHYEGINPAAAAIALKNLAEENPDAGLEVVALEGRGEEKIHLQAVVTGIGDSSRLSAEYSEMYRKIASLPQKDIQTLLALITEKDDRIRSLEKILTTAKEGNNTYYIQAGRDISGVLNLGSISGNVSNAIGQLSTVSETE